MDWRKRATLITALFLSTQHFGVQPLESSEVHGENAWGKRRHEQITRQKHALESTRRQEPKNVSQKASEPSSRVSRQELLEQRAQRRAEKNAEMARKKELVLNEEFQITERMRRNLTPGEIQQRRAAHEENLARRRKQARMEAEKARLYEERAEQIQALKHEKLEQQGKASSATNEAIVFDDGQSRVKVKQKKAPSSSRGKGWFWWGNNTEESTKIREASKKSKAQLEQTERRLHKERLQAQRAEKLEALAQERKAQREQKAKQLELRKKKR